MSVRIPDNIRNIISSNNSLDPGCIEELESLIEGVSGNGPVPPLTLPAPDLDFWMEIYEELRGCSWLDAPWFSAETYLYRQIIQAARYWESGCDPFWNTKTEELYSDAPWDLAERTAAESEAADDFAAALNPCLHAAVWGNRIDLSYKASTAQGSVPDSDLLLIDDSAAASQLLSEEPGTLHIVTDNAGSELVSDLILCYRYLKRRENSAVFHVKQFPTYISDATAHDVYHTLHYMKNHPSSAVSIAGKTLLRDFRERRFSVAPDFFWNSSFFISEMPDRLSGLFREGNLMILKGDMNYRRLFFDTIWGEENPPENIVPGLDFPVLLLRTMKSDCIAGLTDEKCRYLNQEDPEWRVNGKRGVIQLVH